MRLAKLLVLVLLSFFAFSSRIHAAPKSKLKVQIVPMGCQFTVIDTGTNEIEYLTPAACGQAVSPPPGNSSGSPLPGVPDQLDIPTELRPILQDNNEDEEGDALSFIHLESFPEYMRGQPRHLSLPVGQVVHFDTNDEQHSITVKDIGRDYVVLTIASKPFDTKLYIGNQNQYDVTGDGVYDIEITLRSITDGVANIVFRRLTPAPAKTEQQTTVAATTVTSPKKSTNVWPYVIVSVSILCIVSYIIFRRKKA